MTAAISLTGLSNEEIIAYTRWKLNQQVTTPDDSWVPDISGEVRETPNMDHFNMAWLGSTGEFVDVSIGGIVEETVSGEEITRKYSEFGKGFRVTNKERRMGLVTEVQRRIDEKQTAYGRIWANQLLTTLKEAAAGTLTKRSKCIDDKALYATDHPNPTGGSAISNKVSFNAAATTTLTIDEAETMLWTLVETLMGYTDDNGRAINEDADSFVLFAPWTLRRPLAYALGAQVIIDDGGLSRTNLMAQANGMNFRLVTTTQLSAWSGSGSQVALHIADGKSCWRARDPRSLQVEVDDKGIQERATVFATFEERGIGAAEWQSAIHCTLT